METTLQSRENAQETVRPKHESNRAIPNIVTARTLTFPSQPIPMIKAYRNGHSDGENAQGLSASACTQRVKNSQQINLIQHADRASKPTRAISFFHHLTQRFSAAPDQATETIMSCHATAESRAIRSRECSRKPNWCRQHWTNQRSGSGIAAK